MGGPIETNNSQHLNLVFSLSAFHKTTQQFGLMILQDFKQTSFEVEGKKFKLYPFKVEANSTINIPTKIKIPGNLNELDYVIVENPNDVLQENNLEKALSIHETLTLRYLVESNDSLDLIL